MDPTTQELLQEDVNATDAHVAEVVQELRKLQLLAFEPHAIANPPGDDGPHSASFCALLSREVRRYNALVTTVHYTLDSLLEALGNTELTAELQSIRDSLVRGEVPHAWTAVSYPGSRVLDTWVQGLSERLAFVSEWVENGADSTSAIWLGGLYCPESLCPALIREYAAAHELPPDAPGLHVHCRLDLTSDELHAAATKAGAVAVRGIHIQGARWDATKHALADPEGLQLNSELPVVLLEVRDAPAAEYAAQLYDCPLYTRISTPGQLGDRHRAELPAIMTIPIPSAVARCKWTLSGVVAALHLEQG